MRPLDNNLFCTNIPSTLLTAWVKNLNPKDESDVPTMERFLVLREDKDLYSDFYDYFIKSIVGYSKFTSSVYSRTSTSDRDIASVSDEAFTLVLLENSYDRWMDIMKNNNWEEPGKIHGVKSNKDRTSVSNVTTLYTSGGIFYTTDGVAKAKPSKGWSADGITHYNELYYKVKTDRELHPEFITEYLQTKYSENGSTRPFKFNKVSLPPAVHELWDKEEDDNGDEASVSGEASDEEE